MRFLEISCCLERCEARSGCSACSRLGALILLGRCANGSVLGGSLALEQRGLPRFPGTLSFFLHTLQVSLVSPNLAPTHCVSLLACGSQCSRWARESVESVQGVPARADFAPPRVEISKATFCPNYFFNSRFAFRAFALLAGLFAFARFQYAATYSSSRYAKAVFANAFSLIGKSIASEHRACRELCIFCVRQGFGSPSGCRCRRFLTSATRSWGSPISSTHGESVTFSLAPGVDEAPRKGSWAVRKKTGVDKGRRLVLLDERSFLPAEAAMTAATVYFIRSLLYSANSH